MRSRTTFHILVCLAMLGAAGFALPGCGGGGSSGSKADKDLILTRFLLVDRNLKNLGGTGSTNAYRDVRLLFEFNTSVDLASVTSRTIRIGIPTGGGLWLEAPGRYEAVPDKRNQVIFNPTVSKTNVPNPLGLDADALYEVIIPGVGDQETWVTNLDGDPVVKSFFSTFETGGEYQQNFIQPELVSTTPDDGEIGIGSAADIILEFSEPMLPDSFRLGQTMFVRNLTVDRDVLGTLRFSADAKTVTFRPVFGYGKGPSDVFVRVTKSVTNLPGNPIPKEIRLQFQSIFDATRPDFADVQEEFDSNTMEDTNFGNANPLARWNSGATSGFLAGLFTQGVVTYNKQNGWVSFAPWAVPNFNMQWQTMYYSTEVGGSSRVITGFDWRKYGWNVVTVSGVSVLMGHTTSGSLTTGFAANYSDTPVTCVNNVTYTIPSGSNVWYAGPTFTSNFAYNGKDNLILEITHKGASNGFPLRGYGEWYIQNPSSTTRSAYTFPTAPSPRTNAVSYGVRFNYLIEESEAQSLWYDTGIRSPQYLGVVLNPAVQDQPAGTLTDFTFQGAPEDASNPGNADETALTPWYADLDKLSGNRFVRFHVNFRGNRATNQLPSVDRLIFPFIYF